MPYLGVDQSASAPPKQCSRQPQLQPFGLIHQLPSDPKISSNLWNVALYVDGITPSEGNGQQKYILNLATLPPPPSSAMRSQLVAMVR